MSDNRQRATNVVAEWSSGDLSPSRLRDLIAAALNEAAADEVERIADERVWVTEHDNEVVSARDLYEHIARLRGELEPVAYDFPPDATGLTA